jgi:hypothetical protein
MIVNAKPKECSIERKNKIDGLITEYIVSKMAPFNTVEDVSFRKLIHFFEPNYKFPSVKALKSKINDLYEENKGKVIDILESVDSVSIDFDT